MPAAGGRKPFSTQPPPPPPFTVLCFAFYSLRFALRCFALLCVALRCFALRCFALRCVALRCVAWQQERIGSPTFWSASAFRSCGSGSGPFASPPLPSCSWAFSARPTAFSPRPRGAPATRSSSSFRSTAEEPPPARPKTANAKTYDPRGREYQLAISGFLVISVRKATRQVAPSPRNQNLAAGQIPLRWERAASWRGRIARRIGRFLKLQLLAVSI